VSSKAIVDRLLAEDVKAVAITDHHVIDVDRISEMRDLAKGRLVIFPGIELRSELGGSECVHYVGIFSEEADVATIWTKLQGKLCLTPADVAAKGGDQRFYVPFGKGAETIRELEGIVTVHAGKKANSIERIGNAHEFKRAVKQDMANEFIDVLEIGKAEDTNDYRTIVFPLIGFPLPMILCSDNHNIAQYTRKARCWIKADTTFLGLRQVLNEPEGRVYIGETPPALELVSRNKTKYIRSVSFSRSAGHKTNEAWFSGKVEFNHELVAIIGNKGGGKSALADVLGLLGDSSHSESFSFLNSDKFRDPKTNKARCFDATLEWESGTPLKRNLDESVEPSDVEKVKYIPQKYLERICNELTGSGQNEFTQELRAVIFSHVDEADRLSKSSLDELIRHKTEQIESAIAIHRRSLGGTIKKVVDLKERMGPSHKAVLESKLAQRKLELAAHDSSKPVEAKKPEGDPATQLKTDAIAKKIEEKAEQVSKYEAEIALLTEGRAADLRAVSLADRLLERIKNMQVIYDQFKTESADECLALGLNLDDLVKLEIDVGSLEAKQRQLAQAAKEKAESLKPENATGPEHKRVALEKEIGDLKKDLDEPNCRYQTYLKATKDWEVRRSAIVGTEEILDTVQYYEHQLAALKNLHEEEGKVEQELWEAVFAIHRELIRLRDAYRTFYQPVQDFIAKHRVAQDKLHLEFLANVVASDFEDRFLGFINHGRRGSFCGVDEGRRRLREIVKKADFQSEDGLKAFLMEVNDHLAKDMRQDGKSAKVEIKEQLAKGTDEASLLEFLFSLSYLKPDYALRWSGKDIDQLSAGERGTLLLVFYLLIDRSDMPLIIDQPEENLDNQTVYDILVPSIKEAKSRRQIIVVTHNPNLAVVCDAEQVIWASLDKNAANKVTYYTGAIENPLINRKVVDILEGTKPAFDNREAKYSIPALRECGGE
jgi:ABC-type lipoprotein export system ATPase subunit